MKETVLTNSRTTMPMVITSLVSLDAPTRAMDPPFRLDVLPGVSSLDFDEAWPDRIESNSMGVRVPFLGRASLIRNKRASGRTKEIADTESLIGVRAPSVNPGLKAGRSRSGSRSGARP